MSASLQWGQTPLMFAAASGRTEVVKVLLARGADVRATAKVVDISARNRQDSAESRARNARVAAIQKELAAANAQTAGAAADQRRRRARAPAAETRTRAASRSRSDTPTWWVRRAG